MTLDEKLRGPQEIFQGERILFCEDFFEVLVVPACAFDSWIFHLLEHENDGRKRCGGGLMGFLRRGHLDFEPFVVHHEALEQVFLQKT